MNKSGTLIPVDFNVQEWNEFLPPLKPVTVTRLIFHKNLKEH